MTDRSTSRAEGDPPDQPGDELLQRVGRDLASAFRGLLGPGGANARRPTELARRWRLEQTLCTRLYQAMREQDPLRVLRRSPGVPSLRIVLDAARRRGVASDRADATEAALGALEDLIHRAGGAKSKLDTLAARHCREGREKIEHNAKQQVFRGMSSLLGVQAATSIVQIWVFPGDEPGRCHELAVHGYHRLVRHRPELPVLLGVRELLPGESEGVVLEALHGESIDPHGRTTALKEFCTESLDSIEVREEGGKLLYHLKESPGMFPSEVDVFFASLARNGGNLFETPDQPRQFYVYVPQTPVEHTVFDVLVHEDVWRGVRPELVMLRNGDPNAPDLMAHSLDRVDFVESLQNLGSSPAAFADPVYDRLVPLCESIHHRLGMPSGSFRLHRCRLRYPVSGLWYSMHFTLSRSPD